ncbi:MAG: S41 family peptidase [Endomicrobiaceae bacterium]|jgi:carboxyl-terminal processing protease|nr:S41 family peptidase [Endomicrobiaceae bacterium]MDD3729844.1 S41 family peptidase [Endomicrobiaceae bacterium]MDD4166501.1 S41 family peptidase [Endomicrobiaceae bacterium]
MSKFKKFLIAALFIISISSSNLYSKSDETYDSLRMMIDIMEIIDVNYVDETKPKDLVVGAINGVVRTLDPYSQFMDEKAYKEVKTETQGSYGGIGLRITMQDNVLTVLTPMADTPAYFAGILPDDKIVKIDSTATEGMSSDEAVKLMRGNPGTKVVLTIFRPATKQELVFELKRKDIKIETVKKQMIENNIGYIRLSEFNAQSAGDITKMLKDLSKDGMTSLILDLRNNPGGLLDSAIEICSLFIPEESLVVSTKGRDKIQEQHYITKKKPLYPNMPVIILINRGSASASEIVAGTLQDYKRALVIGGNSFGKGSVQTIIPLSDGNALRLTIAKYYLPSGRTIAQRTEKKDIKRGLDPDIKIEVSPETEGKLYIQSEKIKLKDSDKKEEETKITDEALETAVLVIKSQKTEEYIKHPDKYLQDNPKPEMEPENNKSGDVSKEEKKITDEQKTEKTK